LSYIARHFQLQLASHLALDCNTHSRHNNRYCVSLPTSNAHPTVQTNCTWYCH